MRNSAVAFLLLFLSACAVAKPVARVESLHGDKNLFMQETDQAPWYRSHLEQDAEIGNHFRTDAGSMASLRFLLGGKVGLGKGCEVEIITERDVDVVKEGIYLKKGTFWARFDQQKEKPVRIQTAGGVMGIRGTEFLVQVTEDGSTTLSLVEGEVEVIPEEGDSVMASPGMRVNFGPETRLEYKLYEVEEMLEEVRREVGPAFDQLRDSLEETRQALRDAQLQVRTAAAEARAGVVEARVGALVGSDTLRNSGVTGASQDLETAGGSLERLDALLEKMSEGREDTPPAEEMLAVESATTFTWQDMGSEKYAVMLLDQLDDNDVYWVAETPHTSYAYPEDARPLAAGEYRLRVIPLDGSGEVAGEALEFSFRVTG